MLKSKFLAVAVMLLSIILASDALFAQQLNADKKVTGKQTKKDTKTLYGQASFYAAKFEGRPTATGEKFTHNRETAACNVLPLGSWVKVTNLRNGKSIVVRTNDRLHPKTKRIIDLTKTGAQKLGYVKFGLTRVKIEVLKTRPK